MNNSKTINNNNSVNNNDVLLKFGIGFGKKTNSPIKTNKQKLIDSIKREIKKVSGRETLDLKFSGKDNSRKELRFYNKPKNDNTIEFNVKYKSKIVYLGDYEVLRCENDVETYITTLNNCIEMVESLDDNNKVFNQIEKIK